MKKTIPLFVFGFILFLILNCSLLKRPKKIILQNDGGKLELLAAANADTILKNDLEKLRIFITLKNHYSFPVTATRYLSFCECTLYHNGYYYYTVESSYSKKVRTLPKRMFQTFSADTSITMMFYVDIKQVSANKHEDPGGNYTFQGTYSNHFFSDGEKHPLWIGDIKSNKITLNVR